MPASTYKTLIYFKVEKKTSFIFFIKMLIFKRQQPVEFLARSCPFIYQQDTKEFKKIQNVIQKFPLSLSELYRRFS